MRSPRPTPKVTSSKTGSAVKALARSVHSRTVRGAVGGAGSRSLIALRAVGLLIFFASIRAMRFSRSWAIDAFVALAPNLSMMPCIRAISLACAAASLAWRTSSASRCVTYWEYVPRYSTMVPVESSAPRSRWSTRVMASSSRSRSWLMTTRAPW